MSVFFFEQNPRYENNIAFIDESASYTYKDLYDACENLSSSLTRTLLFLFCTNTFGSVVGYIASLRSYTVPLLLSSDLETELRSSLIKTYKPTYLYMPEAMVREFPGYSCVKNLFQYCLLKTEYDEPVPMASDLALLLSTSGSTGSPKLVRQSYKNIQSNAESIASYLELNCTERPITTLPMNYTYGLSIINSHLLVGATVLLTTKTLMQKEFWSFFIEQNATSFGGVPYTYEMLRKLRFFKMSLPSLRTMTQAGGKLSPELHRLFAEYAKNNDKKFIVMYGQTEATARMAYLPWEHSLEKYGSMGIAIPSGRFELLDVDGKIIDVPDVVGELVYYGDNVTLGYATCAADLAKEDEWGRRLVTGDMAKRDDDGFYYIVGRKKRFLKIFGNRVNLDEIEQLLKSNFSSIDVACAGVDDKMMVYSTDESKVKEIKTFLSVKTGLNPVAFEIKYIQEIPKNDAGKTLYSKLES